MFGLKEWAKQIPVAMDLDRFFYVELKLLQMEKRPIRKKMFIQNKPTWENNSGKHEPLQLFLAQ